MKKTIKIVLILSVLIMTFMMARPVYATVDAIIGNVDASINAPTNGTTEIATKAGKIIGALQWIGIVGGVVIMAIFGIKYMMGSIEEKAEYKKTMVPYIVGAVVVMAAPQIAKLIFNMVA